MLSAEDGATVHSGLLLDLDPDLGEGLEDAIRLQARARIVVPLVELEPAVWSPERLAALGQRCFGMLVCQGVIVREVEIAGSRCADLLGPGDLLACHADAQSLLARGDSWHVGEATAVAVLDDHLLPALRAWPSVAASLIARGARQAARSADQRAISQLPRIELRLRALFWHLASRWGRRGVDGVVLPLGLTHEALGRLVGARRPTVTLALGELARTGRVVRRPDGAWLLREDSSPGAVAGVAPDDCKVDAVVLPGATRRRSRSRRSQRPARAPS
jgi:CRP-like cAMP-binding protein